MLLSAPAKKLVIYVSSVDRHGHQPVYKAVLNYLRENGCAGATATKAMAGFGGSGRFLRAKLFRVVEDLPIRIEAVDSPEKIHSVLPGVRAMVNSGLIEVQDTQVVRMTGYEALASGSKTEGSDSHCHDDA